MIRKLQSNVNIVNPLNILYTKGNESTDGSIRFILNSGDTEIELEKRKDGVWNPTGLRLSADTLFFNRGFSLSSIGTNLQTNLTEGGKKFLVLDTEFDDNGSQIPTTPILQVRVNNSAFSNTFDTEISGVSLSDPITITSSVLFHQIHLKTGSIAATEPVEFTITRGLTPGGIVVLKLNIATSEFPANSDITIDLTPGVGFEAGDEITLNFTSDQNISLLGNSSNEFFLTFDAQAISFEDVVSIPTGTDRFLIDNNTGNTMADSIGNLMVIA